MTPNNFPAVWDRVHHPLLRDRCPGLGGEDRGADLCHGQGARLCSATVPSSRARDTKGRREKVA